MMFKWLKNRREQKKNIEAFEKQCELLIDNLHIENGRMQAEFKISMAAAGNLAKAFSPLVKHVENYLTLQFCTGDGELPLEITARRIDKETPAFKASRLQKEVEDLQNELKEARTMARALRSEAGWEHSWPLPWDDNVELHH